MAYPPSTLPVSRTNSSAVTDNHPGDHNSVNQAMNDTVAMLGSNPQGTYATLQARLAALPGSLVAWRYGRINGLVLNANGGAWSPTNFVTATMVAGHLYMYQQTARAIGPNGAWLRLQRDGADYVDPNSGGTTDYYVPIVSSAYSALAGQWFLQGSVAGNAGSHTWRTVAVTLNASTGNYYDNSGGFAALWDLGLDPGSQ
jgi:hypothetical protein